ncbi:uncharacterized protein DUF4349 [Chitinophaga dinghuensis]|uniref:Uncharacterized protein DUF4349 n=1 Tax=Chitinophaga dinghuensis TaxID=1539050 RepID=A0A327VMD4_9BACT|nr:DUF4349 domain-containing protein [Chitinophaga dinghuensis]RAJ74021.1 uncharacterized protein DUF4349 [Chitinophaga dinghuensis]
MSTFTRKDVKRLLLACVCIFVLMFGLRLIYGYLYVGAGNYEGGGSRGMFEFGQSQKNYASASYKMKKDIAVSKNAAPVIVPNAPPPPPGASQKYEKIARVETKTSDYSQDEAKVYQLIDSSASVIQYENKTGNPGSREMQLLIGVVPEKFDSFYQAVQRIGVVVVREVTKTDKTNEYSKLNAQKVSLEKSLASLNELKKQPGKIEDFISLHKKIYETETELQNLGVELGSFDSVNEFCTVQLYLYESKKAATHTIHFTTRLVRALEWTIKYYAIFIVSVAATLIASIILLQMIIIVRRLMNTPPKS